MFQAWQAVFIEFPEKKKCEKLNIFFTLNTATENTDTDTDKYTNTNTDTCTVMDRVKDTDTDDTDINWSETRTWSQTALEIFHLYFCQEIEKVSEVKTLSPALY